MIGLKVRLGFVITFILILFVSCGKSANKSYSIEAINDSLILVYPNPEPVHVVSHSFNVTSGDHPEHIAITSRNLHNISICIENTGDGLIKDPYLFGTDGYDFRDLSVLSSGIVEGVSSSFEKFMRVHEWFTYYYDKYGSYDNPEYPFDDYRGNPLRLINQNGGSLCGEAVQTACGLLYHVPPLGSMYGRKVQMDGHQTGEAWFDGSWHNFDISPEIRWVYFDDDNETIIPSWKDLRDDGGELIKRIRPMTGWDIWSMVDDDSCKPFEVINEVGRQWEFRYQLKPREKMTMYFDMKGRTDKVSSDYSFNYLEDHPENCRKPCDYASAVFTYKPDFTSALHRKYAEEEKNIKYTPNGIEPVNPDEPSSIIIQAKSTWNIVGADINASFYDEGRVYFAVTETIGDTAYSKDLEWILLHEDGVFESDSIGIEGRMAYWLKFEFQGRGSGLRGATISTEVQMGRYTMPGLKFGKNEIRFTAAHMNSSSAKITYTYDDQSKYDYYEPATSNYGRHIYYRVGGNHIKHWTKPLFYRNINNDPEGEIPIKVEIFKVTGEDAGNRIRLFKDGPMKFGNYWWYWDGKDDLGKRCPVGMYSYKVTGEVGEGMWHENNEFGERLYLFDHIWPVPNEVKP